jgi:hypothetical protein
MPARLPAFGAAFGAAPMPSGRCRARADGPGTGLFHFSTGSQCRAVLPAG